MATIRAKLKQLRDADVRYISLVDRAATRIPFRVLKRDDKETEMSIDLTRVFKTEEVVKPFVSALVVFAHPDEAVTASVRDIIQKEGFVVDRVQKSDDTETISYAQGDQPAEVQIVRLGDHVLASVSGLKTPEGWMGDVVEDHGFFPDLEMATSALYDQLQLVAKADSPQDEVVETLSSFGSYLNQMFVLPAACFKIDSAISAVTPQVSPLPEAENPAAKSIEDAADVDRKKRIKNHPPAEMAPVDEEDDQKPPPPEEATKSEEKPDAIAGVLAALQGMEERTTAQFTGLTQKLETVASEQAAQKKVLDGVVQKADTLDTTLKATVTAHPVPEDRPTGPARMRVQKDDDPRTGAFDTAFLRRRK